MGKIIINSGEADSFIYISPNSVYNDNIIINDLTVDCANLKYFVYFINNINIVFNSIKATNLSSTTIKWITSDTNTNIDMNITNCVFKTTALSVELKSISDTGIMM